VNCTSRKILLSGLLDAAAAEARYYDVAVLPWSREEASAQHLIEAVVFGSGRPAILVPSSARPAARLDHIAIAWDASRVAARALGDALPLLAEGGRVTVLTVGDEKPLAGAALASLLASSLEKRGVKAHPIEITLGEKTIAQALQEKALAEGAQMLAMGGFGHSRLRDFVLGGATTGVFAEYAAGMRWHKILARRGWSAPTWPKEYGGTGWSATQRYIFSRECIAADAPRIFAMGLRMVGPVIMKFGTPEQKAKYLPRIVSGDITFCQGYSEPGSGSDLASLKTRAERDGDDYVINGTKIWTTGAHVADHMFCLVRTSSEGKPQDGISFVLIDSMKTPGLTVSPIVTLAGDHEVNQVFFDSVRTPVANRIGPENAGWTVAKYLLEFERGGEAYTPNLHARLEDVKRIARNASQYGLRNDRFYKCSTDRVTRQITLTRIR
jgi:alkylation response protein AidB-like acyl-CoA dehydrogenase